MNGREHIQSLVKGKTATGVQVVLQNEREPQYSYVSLEMKHSGFSILHVGEQLDFSGLIRKMNPSRPVLLFITGKGIVHKIIEREKDGDIRNAVFPNADPDDFFIEEHKTPEKIFLSVVRKNTVGEITDGFARENIPLIDIYIGPAMVEKHFILVSSEGNEFPFGKYTLLFTGTILSDLSKEEMPGPSCYSVYGKEVSGQMLMPLFLATDFFDSKRRVGLLEQTSFKEYRYKRLSKLLGWSGLCLFFICLLVNMLAFGNYTAKHNSLQERYQQGKIQLDKLNELRAQLSRKEEMLKETGSSEHSLLSFYADRIAHVLPEGMVLTKMNLFPIASGLKSDKAISYFQNEIHISGETPGSMILNEWIKALRKEQWTDEIVISRYSQDNNSDPGVFSVLIKIKK